MSTIVNLGDSGGENYSTSEQRIGTWIDGKPIYRKVITGTVSSATEDVSSGISNLDLIIDVKCIFSGTNAIRPNPFTYGSNTSTSNWYSGWTYYKDDNEFRFELGSSFLAASNNYTLIIEYTKTTD